MATETWIVRGLELAVGESEDELCERTCRELGLARTELVSFRIARRALDARRRGGERRLHFVYHVEIGLDARFRGQRFGRARRSGAVSPAPERFALMPERVHASFRSAAKPSIAILGAGPGGLFAAWMLAQHAIACTVIDRGASLESRSRDLVAFHRSGRPNRESNLLYGEGGAGTYSDGKLYTRVDDVLELPILEELVLCGAPAEILFDSRAHVGTDKLHRVLPRLRARLAERGVSFAWGTRVEQLQFAPGPTRAVRALSTTQGELAADALLLAPGHSARDSWRWLHDQGVVLEAKPFQLGVRIEHPQAQIDLAQLGDGPDARRLGASYYALVCKSEGALPAVHSFCMCPGGRIVASVHEEAHLCTNGMSNAGHSSRWANAALVVTLGPDEYGAGVFAGVELQRTLEARFFEAGGGGFRAPAQTAADFLAGRESRGELRTSYRFGATGARLDLLLDAHIVGGLRRALTRFDGAIPGFAGESGLLVGVETRSSGPIRIVRDPKTRLARGFDNLYPIGEGAGYAGGIMSAAIDGARSALALIERGLPVVSSRAALG